jgi:hypothetical protein
MNGNRLDDSKERKLKNNGNMDNNIPIMIIPIAILYITKPSI